MGMMPGLAATMAVAVVAGSSLVAQTRSVFIEDLTSPELRDAIAAGKTSAIIYAGGIEQNGAHMALIKHNVIARHVAGQIAERLGTALVYPIIPFSMNGDPSAEKAGHMRFPGTITVSSDVFLGLIRGVTLSAISAGFKNVFVMGDHGGGQAELKLAAESLDNDWKGKGVHVSYVTLTKSAQQMTAYLTERKVRGAGHAGTIETAQVMAVDLAGQWVHPDKFAVSAAGPEAVTGVSADPAAATAEMGRVFLDYKISDAIEQIRTALAGSVRLRHRSARPRRRTRRPCDRRVSGNPCASAAQADRRHSRNPAPAQPCSRRQGRRIPSRRQAGGMALRPAAWRCAAAGRACCAW